MWGVQMHVAKYKDVLETFQTMCKEAGWLVQGQFDNIYLLYLSPEPGVTELVLKNRRTLVLRSSPRRQSATVKVQSKTVEVISAS